MMKKLVILILLLILTGSIFAQGSLVTAGVSVGSGFPFMVSFAGFFEYEYMFSPFVSMGLHTSLIWYPFAIFLGFENDGNGSLGYAITPTLHVFPFGRTFHVDLGLGFGSVFEGYPGLVIASGFGWKIPLGNSGVWLSLGVMADLFMPFKRGLFGDMVLFPFNAMIEPGLGFSL